MVFCNKEALFIRFNSNVTILILVDGFLQYGGLKLLRRDYNGHNPYFSRWFSAISHPWGIFRDGDCHNPYFSRWFSAILIRKELANANLKSQSLF